MKKQYALLILLWIFLYLLYLVGSYSYRDYQVRAYIAEIQEVNNRTLETIRETERNLNQKLTLAHKNKVLKTEQWMRGLWEEVLFLISEERYRMFTQEPSWEELVFERTISERIWDTKNLIATMTIYERWMYFLFREDVR